MHVMDNDRSSRAPSRRERNESIRCAIVASRRNGRLNETARDTESRATCKLSALLLEELPGLLEMTAPLQKGERRPPNIRRGMRPSSVTGFRDSSIGLVRSGSDGSARPRDRAPPDDPSRGISPVQLMHAHRSCCFPRRYRGHAAVIRLSLRGEAHRLRGHQPRAGALDLAICRARAALLQTLCEVN
jgi:hypothetical protein